MHEESVTKVKKYVSKLDQDQKDIVFSTLVVTTVCLFLSILLPINSGLLLIVFVIQFLITFFLFTNPAVKKKFGKEVYKNFVLLFFVLSLACFSIYAQTKSSSKRLACIVMLWPLWRTRSILYIKKLPLSALYYENPPNATHQKVNHDHFNLHKSSSQNHSILNSPVFNHTQGNIFYITPSSTNKNNY